MVSYLMRITGDRMMLTGSIETLFCMCDTDLLLAIELKKSRRAIHEQSHDRSGVLVLVFCFLQ